MRKNLTTISFLCIIVVCTFSFLPSCKIAKSLPDGQSLLVRNRFNLHAKGTKAEIAKIRADMGKIVVQKPNNRVFGFMPIRMWLYHSATKGKKLTKFKQFIIDKVGEPPVVFDSSLLLKSRQQVQLYLFNYGYLHASVSDTFSVKNKKATITYKINTDAPWRIGEVQLPNGHTPCDSIVRANYKASFLHRGERFDAVNLKNERDRIETLLRNNGYFTFNREYVTFEGDSLPKDKLVNIKIRLNSPADFPEHEQFRMNKVFIITDFTAETFQDTTRRDTSVYGSYYIIYHKKNYRKNILLDAVFFRKDSLYSKEDELRTISHLSQLGVFKFINIDYIKAAGRDSNYLDCVIQLTPGKRQEWGATADLDISDELLFGTQGSLTYTNRNLSKGADRLIIEGSGGVQVRFTRTERKRRFS